MIFPSAISNEELIARSKRYIDEKGGYWSDRFCDSTRSKERGGQKKLGFGAGPYSRIFLMAEQPTFYTLHTRDLGLSSALSDYRCAFDWASINVWRQSMYEFFGPKTPILGRFEVGGRQSRSSKHRLHAHVIADLIDNRLSKRAAEPIYDLKRLAEYFSKAAFPKNHVIHGAYLLTLQNNRLQKLRMPPLSIKRGVPNHLPISA